MIGVISVLVVITLSILITRIATVVLTHTGLSRESASFQARSAFTGVGFTTSEAEQIVNHPVRRRVVRTLMLLGNAGIVTVISSLMLGLLGEKSTDLWVRTGLLLGGLGLLWVVASNKHVERWLSHVLERILSRHTELEIQDYASLLHLAGDYHVSEIMCKADDWMEGQTLSELNLRDEGVIVLGVTREDGTYIGVPKGSTRINENDTLTLYGRANTLLALDKRRKDAGGEQSHRQAVAQQQQTEREEQARDPGAH
ncbi:potassium transporter TrkA [Proteobacteria bacterium 005FR1]|nr:potassium transporter TrkA [Proteobacteria bacterium 005FR1]